MPKSSEPRVEVENPVKKRGARPGGRQDTVQRLPVAHSLCQAVLLRSTDHASVRMIDDAVASARQSVRANLHPVVTRAKRSLPGVDYQLITGSFRTDAGDFVVVGVVTRTA